VKVVWTEQACRQLAAIEAFVAQDDPRAAAKLVERLLGRAEALSSHPDRGRKVPEIPGSNLRELLVNNYRVVYRRTPNAIEILTVFEGHRLLHREELTGGL
jgi:toxin ParE1/3/4